MDSFNRKDASSRVKSMYPSSVFPSRPWMMNVGAAAAAGDGNKGLKGVVAGKSQTTYRFVFINFKLHVHHI